MEKPAQNDFPIHDLLKQRWSPRAFSDRLIDRETLSSLLEAIRWSASCFNEQPWRVILATRDHPQEFERLGTCLLEGNRRWVSKASALMLNCAKKTFTFNGNPNFTANFDLGLGVGSLVFQAAALGLHTHHMAGFNRDVARQTYQIPEDYDPIAMIAIGYMGALNDLPEELQEKEKAPRTRKPLSEFVFTGNWEQSAF